MSEEPRAQKLLTGYLVAWVAVPVILLAVVFVFIMVGGPRGVQKGDRKTKKKAEETVSEAEFDALHP